MNKRITLYYDGQLSEAEKQIFEADLIIDPKLKFEYDKFILNINLLKSLDSIELKDSYFVNSTITFREKLHSDKNKFFLSPKFGLGLSLATSVLLLMFMTFRVSPPKINPTIEKTVSTLSNDDINKLLDSMSISEVAAISELESTVDSSQINNIDENLAEEILKDGTQLALLEKSETYESLTNNINDAEADVVYNEIIQKDIIKGK